MPKTKTGSVLDSARRLGDDVVHVGRSAYLFGLGALATADEEVRGMFDRMVAKGERFEKTERNVIGKAADRASDLGRDVEQRFKATVTATLNRAGVPSRDEIHTLIDRVEKLTDRVETLAVPRARA